MNELHDVLTVSELAKFLRIGINKAYDLVRNPNFPCFKLGNRIIIPREAFLNWLNVQAQEHAEIAG